MLPDEPGKTSSDDQVRSVEPGDELVITPPERTEAICLLRLFSTFQEIIEINPCCYHPGPGFLR